MSERIIKIEPYKTYDDIIRLSGKVILPNLTSEINIPENRNLNLFKYEFNENTIIIPREYESFDLKINLSWRQDSHIGMLDSIVLDVENPAEVLALRIQIQCEKTKWCSEQKKVELGSVTKRTALNFQIPLNEVRNFIKVVAFITREVEGKNTILEIPTSSLSIISTCKELSIQIDEIKDIGGEYLPISSGNIGDLSFDIQGLENPFELPRILYSEELKEYLTRDDLPTVNASILTALFYFLDQYLKWVIFTCRLDLSNKLHKSIIDMFSTYCNVSREDLIEVINKEKFCTEQTQAFLELSQKLFKGLQLQNKYKKELRNLFKTDAK
jgi:hypothetical protein